LRAFGVGPDDSDYINIEMHLADEICQIQDAVGGHEGVRLEMHLEAVTSNLGDALGSYTRVQLEEHLGW